MTDLQPFSAIKISIGYHNKGPNLSHYLFYMFFFFFKNIIVSVRWPLCSHLVQVDTTTDCHVQILPCKDNGIIVNCRDN